MENSSRSPIIAITSHRFVSLAIWLAVVLVLSLNTRAGDAPTITQPPQPQSAVAGLTATLEVAATGTTPLAFRWQKDGVDLPGATGSAVVLENLTTNQAGVYTVFVSNDYGTNSAGALLTVALPECVVAPSGIVSWWQAENNDADNLGLNSGGAPTRVFFSPGMAGQAFAFYGGSDGISLGDPDSLKFTDSFSVEGWIKIGAYPTPVYGNNAFFGAMILARGDNTFCHDPYFLGVSPAGSLTFHIEDYQQTYFCGQDLGTQPLALGKWYHVGAVFDSVNQTMQIFTNGVLAAQTTCVIQPFRDLIPQFSPGVGIGNYGNNAGSAPFTGQIDELAVYHGALTAQQMSAIYHASYAGKCPVPPAITSQPQAATNLVGTTATFYLGATGSQPLSYQWQKNGTNLINNGRIAGVTTPTLTVSPVQVGDDGNYQVMVANAGGTATSSVSPLTVLVPATIVVPPVNQSVYLSSNAVFSASVAGDEPLAYQWYFNGAPLTDGGRISGSATTNLVVANVQPTDGGYYQFVATNIYGSANASATLIVLYAPVMTLSPTNRMVLSGTSVSLAAFADGTSPLVWRWYLHGAALTNGGRFSGATGPTYSISGTRTNEGGLYTVIVTNNYGAVTNSATLTVYGPAQVIGQPASAAVLLNSNITFAADTAGTALSYQWYFNGAPLADSARVNGTATPTLNIDAVQASDAGGYALVVTNIFSTTTSRLASLTVQASLAASVRYVNVSNSAPASPYLDWSTAATNIQDAVDAAVAGDTILVTNGVYQSGGRAVYGTATNRVAVDKSVTLKSVNGPTKTSIQGFTDPKSLAGTRCIYLTNGALLAGFTLTNGNTLTRVGDAANELSGGGAWCQSASATISNCIIVGCSAYTNGAGVYQGTVVNCLITNNVQTSDRTCGGGVYGVVLYNSILANNKANSGGGAAGSTLVNCLVVKNAALSAGGGSYGSTLINCTVVSNTLTGQSLQPAGAGVYGGTLTNCVVYYNPSALSPNLSGGFAVNCCSLPRATNGFGNFSNPPAFLNLAAADFHLSSNSPCINAGLNTAAGGILDLDGNPRLSGGALAVGAYEFQSPASILSYAWAQQYGLPTDGTADNADADGDGFDNFAEWKAGTNPTNNLSALRMAVPAVTNINNGPTVTWQSVTNVTYYLQRAFVLPAFTAIQSNILGQPITTSYADTTATNAGPYFYRVGVQ